jgi:hypothetical protein
MGLRGCFMAPASLALKNHSSKMGARNFTCFLWTLKIQLRIQEESSLWNPSWESWQTTKIDHLRHIKLSLKGWDSSHFASGVGSILHRAMLVLPAVVHPIIVGITMSTSHLEKLWVSKGSASLAEEEQWAIQLPRWWLFERIHLFIEAVVCGQRNSAIRASVGKHRRYLFVSEVDPHVFRVFQLNAERHTLCSCLTTGLGQLAIHEGLVSGHRKL